MPGRRQKDPEGDLYERLGVAPGADAREIRRCYLQLVARYHPDRHQGNPLGELAKERLAEINAAYEVLSDPARRAAYNARGDSAGGAGGAGGAPGGTGTARARGPWGAYGPPRRPGRVVLTLLVLAASSFVGLRLAPAIGRFFATIFGSGPGRILGPVVLAVVVLAIIVWSRSRRSGR